MEGRLSQTEQTCKKKTKKLIIQIPNKLPLPPSFLVPPSSSPYPPIIVKNDEIFFSLGIGIIIGRHLPQF